MLGCRVNDNKLENGSLFGINPGSFVRYKIMNSSYLSGSKN